MDNEIYTYSNRTEPEEFNGLPLGDAGKESECCVGDPFCDYILFEYGVYL